MARRVYTKKTPDERKAELDALHASLTEQVDALRDDGKWKQFLSFSASFHQYSLNNQLLILAQNPAARHVAGYGAWQKQGRQVRKGEHGIKILGGFTGAKHDVDDQTGEETTTGYTYFRPVSVFDIDQTDPLPGHDDIQEPHLSRRLTGDDPAGIFEATCDYLADLGWTVSLGTLPGGVNGATDMSGTRQIVVKEGLAPAQRAKTVIHEAAHVLLHEGESHAEYLEHRGIKETEAESVAYVTAGVLGLDTADYSIGYVATWSQCDLQIIKDTAKRVLKAAYTLTEALAAGADPDATTALQTPSVGLSAPVPVFEPAELAGPF